MVMPFSRQCVNYSDVVRQGRLLIKSTKSKDYPPELDWVAPESITSYTELGNPGNTAQVHPHLFTNKIASLAEEQGVKFILGSAMGVNYTDDGSQAKSVTYKAKDGSDISEFHVSDIVIAAGPWTTKLLPGPLIKESRNHSIVVRPT